MAFGARCRDTHHRYHPRRAQGSRSPVETDGGCPRVRPLAGAIAGARLGGQSSRARTGHGDVLRRCRLGDRRRLHRRCGDHAGYLPLHRAGSWSYLDRDSHHLGRPCGEHDHRRTRGTRCMGPNARPDARDGFGGHHVRHRDRRQLAAQRLEPLQRGPERRCGRPTPFAHDHHRDLRALGTLAAFLMSSTTSSLFSSTSR